MNEQPQTYAPNVYGLVGGAVNVYLLDDPESGLTIIDAGLPGGTRRILQLIRDIGRTPQDVKHILITHADIDHIGGLHALVKATGAPVYASEESARYIQKCQSPPHVTYPMKLVVTIVSRLALRPVEVTHIITDGDVLDIAGGIQVIATPGHTPDHHSFFWQREKVLFNGDLLEQITENQLDLSPHPAWSVEESRKSAQRVLALEPAFVCSGHGQVWKRADNISNLK